MRRTLPLSAEAIMARLQDYIVVSDEHYEPIDEYEPAFPYSTALRHLLGPIWRFKRSGVWVQALPPRIQLPLQGWKIHVSANLDNAEEILSLVAKTCLKENVTFKFLLDRLVLQMCNAKSMPRGSSGKFVTIYPQDVHQFRTLLDQLYGELSGFEGPYVLSDNRYQDCRVLYYRFGGFSSIESVDWNGDHQLQIVAPDGSLYPDVRAAYFALPPWVSDPFQSGAEPDNEMPTLKEGRYAIEEALRFTNAGGVYRATDRDTQRNVVVKEARPWTELHPNGVDAPQLRRREWKVLCHLKPLGIVPDPIDFFTEWEHTYLVESYETGATLWDFVSENNSFILPDFENNSASMKNYAKLVTTISRQLIDLVSKVHRAGVVIGDISFNNILVAPDGSSVKLIDLESATRRGDEPLVKLATPGFAAKSRRAGKVASFATFDDDRYALGALLMTLILPVQTLNELDAAGSARFLESMAQLKGFPKGAASAIVGLMQVDPTDRISLDEARLRLDGGESDAESGRFYQPSVIRSERTTEIARITTSILSMYTPERVDRLFHASPSGEHSLGVATGAMGVVKFLGYTQCGDTRNVIGEALLRIKHAANIRPGLYNGLAGISWVLLELGLQEEASAVYRRAMEHPHLYHSFDLYGGAAGVGMSSLKFWMETGDQAYLQDARNIGSWICDNAHLSETGARWENGTAEWPVGYAHGSSGLSMFLLYLGLADSAPEFSEIGSEALDYDLSNALTNPNGRSLSFPVYPGGKALFPFWYTGSAGVGTALLRYREVFPSHERNAWLDRLMPDVKRQFAVTPSLLTGLAGVANYLMDCRTFGLHSVSESDVHHCLDGVRLFEVENEHGLTGGYPGPFLARFATDYAFGAAGIGAVLYRDTKSSQANFNFMLDELLA